MKVLVILTGLRWRFGLDRRMFDPEPLVECSGHCNPDAIGIDALAERHMGGAIDLVRSHRPDVQVMNAGDTRNGGDR